MSIREHTPLLRLHMHAGAHNLLQTRLHQRRAFFFNFWRLLFVAGRKRDINPSLIFEKNISGLWLFFMFFKFFLKDLQTRLYERRAFLNEARSERAVREVRAAAHSLLRQYLYFCTSKEKQIECLKSLLRQYLYFCTRKARKKGYLKRKASQT